LKNEQVFHHVYDCFIDELGVKMKQVMQVQGLEAFNH
jgi:hypothetical protein